MRDGVNHMENVAEFLDRWRSEGKAPETELPLLTTRFGNINQSGVPGEYRSPDLTRTEARFFDGVEPGVRELVRLLVERFDWTTYTSCQGHSYPGTEIVPVERHVGVLPANEVEYAHVRAVIRDVVATFHHRRRWSFVRPFLYELMLTSNDGRYPVIDLVFRKSPAITWDQYFVSIEPAYRATLDILRDLLERRRALLTGFEGGRGGPAGSAA